MPQPPRPREREAIERALDGYDRALIVVSHVLPLGSAASGVPRLHAAVRKPNAQ